MRINGRDIGAGFPTYVIAELSANHRQSLDVALATVKAAKEAGADAIKLQTYTPDTITLESDAPWFQLSGDSLWSGKTLHTLYREAYMPWDWHQPLQAAANDLGIDLFSTPFDSSAVDLLSSLNMPAFKIASFELNDLMLIRRVAATGKPLIMSTGMATLAEIEEAVSTARAAGAREIALLKCTSAYPTPAEEANLRTIPHLAEAFQLPVGLSDHTLGIATSVAAVAIGACIIEKHLTLARADGGPDSAFSLEPDEFRQMVEEVRTTEAALGHVHYGPSPQEEQNRQFRRSLFVVRDVRAGESFTDENIRSIRPAAGLHTRYYEDIVGKRARRDVARGTPLSWELVDQ